MIDPSWQTIKAALREVLEEEMGVTGFEMTLRFENGTLIFKPADPSLKSKDVPIEAFFKKITSVREKLRVLEQKINSHERLSTEDKAEFQGLITRAYGSLTTFNFLFKEEEDHFEGMKS